MKSAAQPSHRFCIAILLAGGSGSRYSQQFPKQFSLLNSRPVFAYAMDTLNACSHIDEIVLVIPSNKKDTAMKWIDKTQWHKLKRPLIQGGVRRCDSCFNALKALKSYPPDTIVLVHDAARPLISNALIVRSIAALATNAAVSTALPLTNTLAEVDKEQILHIVPRTKYCQLQTPQLFSLQLLSAAYDSFYAQEKQKECEPTDDCSIVRIYDKDTPIKLILGEISNMKLTHPADLQILESFLSR